MEEKRESHWKKMLITEVFGGNFEREEGRVMRALQAGYRTIAFDTEYPGTMINTPRFADEAQRYGDMKSNVERTKLIQVGFTLFNAARGEVVGAWQFNLSGFDPGQDVHNPDAIEMLGRSGIDFADNNARGVKMHQLVGLLKKIRDDFYLRVQWVTFHGLYDAAYLVAAVHGKWALPSDVRGFSRAAGELFNGGIFDLKSMAEERGSGWMGLEKLAAALGAAREEGCAHQAGSDSLLTAKAFLRALRCSLVRNVEAYRRRLFGISELIVSDHHPRHRPRPRPQIIYFVPAPVIAYTTYIWI